MTFGLLFMLTYLMMFGGAGASQGIMMAQVLNVMANGIMENRFRLLTIQLIRMIYLFYSFTIQSGIGQQSL